MGKLSLILLGSMLMMSIAVAQHHFGRYDYPGQGFFPRGGYNPFPSYLGGYQQLQEAQFQPEGRLFFTTLTITISTTTATSTSTSTNTCTTSTATLSTCTPGRRRRHATSFADGKKLRGLLYNEDDEFKDDEMSNIFLSNPKSHDDERSSVMNLEPSAARPVRENAAVPYVVQPGFRAPDSVGSGRFLLSFYTTTTTTTTTTTSTTTLTATCSSQTSWPTCGSGK